MRYHDASPFPWTIVSASAGMTLLISGLAEKMSTDRFLVFLSLMTPLLFSVLVRKH